MEGKAFLRTPVWLFVILDYPSCKHLLWGITVQRCSWQIMYQHMYIVSSGGCAPRIVCCHGQLLPGRGVLAVISWGPSAALGGWQRCQQAGHTSLLPALAAAPPRGEGGRQTCPPYSWLKVRGGGGGDRGTGRALSARPLCTRRQQGSPGSGGSNYGGMFTVFTRACHPEAATHSARAGKSVWLLYERALS